MTAKPRPNDIDLLPVPVAVASARVGAIASYYETTATLEVEKQADIVSRVTGVIEAILVEEGDEVPRDTPVLKIANDEYLHHVEKAVANTKNLQAKLDRLKQILDQDIVSVEEFDTAKNELETAKADESLAKLSLSYTTVRAPFSGAVTHRYVDIGQKVGADTRLFTIADFRPLLARVHVPAKEFRKIQPNQTVELVLDSNDQRLQGRITLVSPIIDASTGTIKVTMEIPDYPPGTRPGDFASVLIVTERREGSVLVPKHAVISEKGERIVYVASQEQAERRVVEVGFESDVDAEILSGVEAGEQVVTKGQRSLKHGSLLKVLERDSRRGVPNSDNVES